MKMTGWIKLHRKIRENPIYMNSHAVHVWIECLLRASHKKKEFYLGREKIILNEGQFVMGRKEFADSIGMSGSTAWFWLNQFKVDSMVDIQTIHGKGSIISILRWSDYQVLDSIVDTKKTQNEHKKNTNKNIKKEKNDKNKIKLHSCEDRRSLILDNPDVDICKRFLSYIRKYHDNRVNSLLRDREEWELYEQWLRDMETLNNKGYGREKILQAIKFAINSDFWRDNFYSISKLNKKNKYGVLFIDEFLQQSKEKKSDKEKILEWLE